MNAARSTNEILAEVAKKLGFKTLETRNSDELDFREVSVWEVKKALEAAFEAGWNAAKNQGK